MAATAPAANRGGDGSGDSGDSGAGSLGDALSDLGRAIPFFPEQVPNWSRPIILLLLLLALGLALRTRLVESRAQRLMHRQETLVGDLASAQRALVSSPPAELGGLAVSVAYRPADGPGAGGDFYDVFPLPDGRVGILLGDVSGHGCEAVERATLVRYTLRAYLEAGLEPRAVLKIASVVLGDDPDSRFATAAVATFDQDAGVLTFALAGHPPPILAGAVDQPVGGVGSGALGFGLPSGERQTTLSLPRGAWACFFTDGLTEARAGDAMLGTDHLERLLAAQGEQPSAAAVLEGVRMAADRASDDMAACIVRATGGDPARVHVEEIEVAPEDVAGRHLFRFLTACGLDREQVAAVVGEACEAVGETGALLRIRMDESGPTVAVIALGADDAFGESLAAGPERRVTAA